MPDDEVVEVSPTPTGPRHRRGLAIGAVLVVLAAGAGVGTWAATRDSGASSPGAASGVDGCPGAVTVTAGRSPQVPAVPTASGTTGRLVPDREPTTVQLCEYPSSGATGTAALARSGSHAGGDAAVAALVATARAATVLTKTVTIACPSFSDAPPPVDLVGLTYEDGTVWLASSGRCSVSNGTAVSLVDIATPVTTALGSDAGGSSGTTVGHAPPSAGGGVPGGGSTGGPGAGPTILPAPDNPFESCAATTSPRATGLVPFTPVGVRVCHVAVDPSADAPTAVDRSADVASGLASALAGLPTLEPDVVCTAIGGEQWGLLFTAADGTTAAVQVDAGGCGSATNGVQTVKTDATFYDLLHAAE